MTSKVTGTIRKVDDLGRIVLPKEQRNQLGINEGTALSISAEGDKLTLKIAEHYCALCSKTGELIDLSGKNICGSCIQSIKKL